MGAVGSCKLKVVDQTAYVFVAQKLAVPIAELPEDLSLEDGMLVAVALVAEDFEGSEAVLVVWPGSPRRGGGEEDVGLTLWRGP